MNVYFIKNRENSKGKKEKSYIRLITTIEFNETVFTITRYLLEI